MIRVAAVGDVHFDHDSAGRLSCHSSVLDANADLLILAGDLTQHGSIEEAEILAHDLATVNVPIVAVLGNHDYHSNQEEQIRRTLGEVGVITLEKETTTLQIGNCRVGIFGMKGFGGGFVGACASDFGEIEMKAFIGHTKYLSAAMHQQLQALEADIRIVVLHYSPIAETLLGERREIYPFLGSYLLAQAIDDVGADVIFHGHAHRGVERGQTPGGIPVRNVAQPVIRHTFHIYTLNKHGFEYVDQAISSRENEL
jgi:Icc-related predicted phosphoesterase